MPAESSVLMVVVMKDGALIGSEVFTPGTYRLGRGDDMDLRLEDARVSVHHASFLFVNGQIGIRDEASHNGVFINGEKVKSARINPRDEVEVAPFTLKMRIVQKRKNELHPEVSPREVTAPARFLPQPPVGALPRLEELPAQPRSASLADEGDEPTVLAPVPPATQRPPVAQRLPSATPPRGATRPEAVAMLQPRPIPRSVVPPPAATPAAGVGNSPDSLIHPPFHTTVAVSRPKGLAVVVPKAPRPARPLPQPIGADLKLDKALKKPALRVQLLWGELNAAAITGTRTFLPGEAVSAGPSEQAPMPVYGFPGGKRLQLAKFYGGTWHVFVPDGVELLVRRGGVYAKHDVGPEKSVELQEQESAVLRAGDVSVELISEFVAARVGNDFRPQLEKSYWIPMVLALGCAAALIAYVKLGPKDLPDFSPRALPPIRAILQAPKKKKVEPKPDKIVEKKKDEPKIAQKPAPKPPKQLPVQAQPVAAAVKKLADTTKLTNKLLAAVTNIGKAGKMGNGMDYKASGLMGKLPLAMSGGNIAGLGKSFGGGGGAMNGIGFAGLRAAGVLGKGNVGRRGVAGAPVTIPRGGGRVQGTLPMDAVRKVVDSRMGAIQRCYEGALIRNPSIAGKVVFEWTIGTDGLVKTAKTKISTLPGSEVVDCIRESLVTWRFPPPRGGVVVVSYPFLFNSVGN